MSVSPAGEKIVTKLRERRQIDAALRRLPAASSELDLRRQVRAIARHGAQAIPSLVAGLDRADAGMVTAIGLVAAELDRAGTADAFYRMLEQPGHSFSARSAAVTILEQFLGVQVPDDLRPGLAETTSAVLSTLDGTVDRAANDPLVLVGAVQELDRQEPDVVLAAVGALRAMAGARPVELLRMLALDVRAEVAAEAISALGGLRIPEAARALQSIVPAAGSELRPLAEHLLRKQQLAGVEVAPLRPASTAYRALTSPLDGEGQRQLWLVEETAGPAARQVLVLVLSDEAGVVDAAEQRLMNKSALPGRQPAGTWIVTRLGRAEIGLIEVSWDTGRRLVAEALDQNRETQIPLPGLLRWLAAWLWGTRPSSLSRPPALKPEAGAAELVAQSDLLVRHPAFVAWHPAHEAAAAVADEILRHPGWDEEIWVRRLAAGLVAEPGMARRLSRRLRANAEWLALAGETLPARAALAAAGAVAGEEPQQVPFVLALVRRDLRAALEWMEPSGREPESGRKQEM